MVITYRQLCHPMYGNEILCGPELLRSSPAHEGSHIIPGSPSALCVHPWMSPHAQVGYFHGYIDGVDYVFVDHACFQGRQDDIYGGDRQQILFRCALLCKAALEAPWHVPAAGGAPYGDENLVFIANDWHTALLPVYLQVSASYFLPLNLESHDIW